MLLLSDHENSFFLITMTLIGVTFQILKCSITSIFHIHQAVIGHATKLDQQIIGQCILHPHQ